MGTKIKLSSAYHLQTDGQSERTNQTLEDLLRYAFLLVPSSCSSFIQSGLCLFFIFDFVGLPLEGLIGDSGWEAKIHDFLILETPKNHLVFPSIYSSRHNATLFT